MTKTSKFDVVQYLDSEEVMAEYLTAAMENDNPDVFLAALSDVAKARGIVTQIICGGNGFPLAGARSAISGSPFWQNGVGCAGGTLGRAALCAGRIVVHTEGIELSVLEIF